jgi:hypothetical protein
MVGFTGIVEEMVHGTILPDSARLRLGLTGTIHRSPSFYR